MSPVPEPMHGGRQGPGGADGEEDLTSANVPPGPVLPSSSDEELDANDSGSAPPGYQPLPQDCEPDEEEENGVDYSSLSGLMSALATHGITTIPADEGDAGEATGTQEEEEEEEEEKDDEGEKRSNTSALAQQEWEAKTVKETAVVWNSSPPAPDRLQLDCGKVEQIKSAMASFTLPESSIPPWAHNLSEEEWKSQVSSLLARQGCQ